MVRQRVGQNKFRDAMLDYWGGACAVTGVAIPEVHDEIDGKVALHVISLSRQTQEEEPWPLSVQLGA